MNTSTTETVAGVMVRLTEAWQAKDVPGYLALLADQVDVVNRGGQRLAGKQAFGHQLNWLLGYPEIFEAEHTLESVRVLRRGVALAHELRVEPLRQSRATYLLVEREGQWLIESIAIAPIELPRDPATGERM
ncbi:SgcJ/EcaC family oxidoreductase [Streptomyces sp. NPDC050485]|uniref:SgcJ/EcaC family oxidoreductase n=1 Tax=Streptomyces sp. NPDC050485 TaxID=3365617 RepID=UPI00379F538B